jgi:hypothetical protein
MIRETLRKIGPINQVYQFFTIVRRVAALESHMVSQLQALGEHDWATDNLVATLRAQAEHMLSSSQVPDDMAAEFAAWKAANPVPDQPLVSVCVATYNRAQLLVERCIASVLEQTYRNLELIVVGDHCTDETAEAVSRIDDPRLRFINLPERGTYPSDPMLRWMVAGTAPMNHALAMAHGDYVTHLDDDDEYVPDRLETLVAFAGAHQYDLVWHPFWLEDGQGQWAVREAPEFDRGQVTTSSVFYRSWFTRIPWDIDAYRFREPGDWNRFRRFKHLAPTMMRYPEPLLRHYCEGGQRQ